MLAQRTWVRSDPVPGRESRQADSNAFLTALAVIVSAYILWIGRSVVLLVLAGVLLAVLLRTAAAWLERNLHIPRRLSLPVALLVLAMSLAAGVWLRGPAIADQIDQLQQKLPQAAKLLVERIGAQNWGRWLIAHGYGAEQMPRAMELLPRVSGILSTTMGFVAALLIVLFLGITMAAEPETYYEGVANLFDPKDRAAVTHLLTKIGTALRWWLKARLISMCAVGLMAFAGLLLLRVPLAGTLGVLAALLTFIPNVGPFLSAIPPVLLAFSNTPRQALSVIFLFCTIHLIEGFFITPIAEREAVHLPPALTLSVQMLLAFVAGPLGVALAAPITTISMAVVRARSSLLKPIEDQEGIRCPQVASAG